VHALSVLLLMCSAVAVRKRPIPGHCTKCRYDLRSLPTDSPCPECGMAAKSDPDDTLHPLRSAR
jgi:hypothetical protein